jgi:hypothetical protein
MTAIDALENLHVGRRVKRLFGEYCLYSQCLFVSMLSVGVIEARDCK